MSEESKDVISEEITIKGESYERTKTVLKRGEGPRGLGLIKFSDRYLQKCSIQDSSLASEAAIWLGIDNTGPHLKGPKGEENEDVNSRMHLTQSMVKQLLPILKEFAKTGEYVANMDLTPKPKKKAKK